MSKPAATRGSGWSGMEYVESRRDAMTLFKTHGNSWKRVETNEESRKLVGVTGNGWKRVEAHFHKLPRVEVCEDARKRDGAKRKRVKVRVSVRENAETRWECLETRGSARKHDETCDSARKRVEARGVERKIVDARCSAKKNLPRSSANPRNAGIDWKSARARCNYLKREEMVGSAWKHEEWRGNATGRARTL